MNTTVRASRIHFLLRRVSRMKCDKGTWIAPRPFPRNNNRIAPDFIARNSIVNNLRTKANMLLSSSRNPCTRTSARDSERPAMAPRLRSWRRKLVRSKFCKALMFNVLDVNSSGFAETGTRSVLTGVHQVEILKAQPAVRGNVTNP